MQSFGFIFLVACGAAALTLPAAVFVVFLWPVLLPAYWIVSTGELLVVTLQRHAASQQSRIYLLLFVQFIAPFLGTILYPILPGSTFGGEPLGLSERSGNALFLTTFMCLFLMANSLMIVARRNDQPS